MVTNLTLDNTFRCCLTVLNSNQLIYNLQGVKQCKIYVVELLDKQVGYVHVLYSSNLQFTCQKSITPFVYKMWTFCRMQIPIYYVQINIPNQFVACPSTNICFCIFRVRIQDKAFLIPILIEKRSFKIYWESAQNLLTAG